MTPTDRLRSALRDLPLLEAQAVRLAYGMSRDHPYEHSVSEIARRMGVSTGKAHELLEAGLHTLKLRLR
jgi:DNA-directed RNA polymerase specialized sigma24 family protein